MVVRLRVAALQKCESRSRVNLSDVKFYASDFSIGQFRSGLSTFCTVRVRFSTVRRVLVVLVMVLLKAGTCALRTLIIRG